MEIDHEIISTVILLPLIPEWLVSVTTKVCTQSTGKRLSQACPGKSVVRLTDRRDMTIAADWDRLTDRCHMTIAVDWDVKQQTKQTYKERENYY